MPSALPTKFRPKKLKNKMHQTEVKVAKNISLLFKNFYDQNFVREAYDNKIHELFRNNSKGIWFLWSEFF